MVLAHVGLLAIWDLAARPVAMLLCLGGGTVALALAGKRLTGERAPTVGGVLLVVVVLRGLLLPVPPALSDDDLRHLWAG